MNTQEIKRTNELLDFIRESPTAFHAVESITDRLDKAGFCRLNEFDAWDLVAGGSYYVTRNSSSVIAFRIPATAPRGFMIMASHTDSPMFKVKPNGESVSCNRYVRLNTEVYGGTILSSWFDRPLSLAGRVILEKDGKFTQKTLKIDRDLLLIPNVAIHMNRTVNSGYNYNPAVDTLPLISEVGGETFSLTAFVAGELGCDKDEIVGMDLYVVSRAAGSIWGAKNEYFSAPRIDNLMCAYGTLCGLIESEPTTDTVPLYYAADNEETGSATKQGAGSVFLSDVLDRICESFGCDKRRLLASSMMVSADNAHARHPNHPELCDAQNAPMMGGGVVIKTNAAQKYTTDGVSAALFAKICNGAEVPVQYYANRSDMAGGSTLGSISNTRVPLITVDIGMAQLAMHSSYETASVADTNQLIRASAAFYNSSLTADGDGQYRLISCRV